MATWRRVISTLGEARLIAALGFFYLGFTLLKAIIDISEARSLDNIIIESLMLGAIGLIFVYASYRLPHLAIDQEVRPRIVAWIIGGTGTMLGILGVVGITAMTGIDRPRFTVMTALGIGAVAGLAIGVNESQALSRAHEAETAKAELETTVEQLEASNERLERFAYAASHDLQEPLRMISTYLQLIERRYDEAFDEEGRELLAFAVDGADRMREMINALLEYSRIETEGDSFQSVDLASLIDEVFQDFQVRIEESNTDITIHSLPNVQGDPRQIRQVFQNLIDNAIEYSGDDPPAIYIDAEREGDYWAISVEDDGIGIATDNIERIFEVFERLHSRETHDGTGIGLAVCERIVERHGGEIRVDSQSGEGTTFTVTLPATAPDLKHASSSSVS